jgi:hypothetical protein
MQGISSWVPRWVDYLKVRLIVIASTARLSVTHLELLDLETVATSTGTTIVGVKYGGGDSGEEEGVCLGADTRATGGPIVADKNCEKVCYRSGL